MITFRSGPFRRLTKDFKSNQRTVFLAEAGRIRSGPLVDFLADLKQFEVKHGFRVPLVQYKTVSALPSNGKGKSGKLPVFSFPVNMLVAFEAGPKKSLSKDAVVTSQSDGTRLVFPKPEGKDGSNSLFVIPDIHDLTLSRESSDWVVTFESSILRVISPVELELGWFDMVDPKTGLFIGTPMMCPNGLVPPSAVLFNPLEGSYIGPLVRSSAKQHVKAGFYTPEQEFSLVVEVESYPESK